MTTHTPLVSQRLFARSAWVASFVAGVLMVMPVNAAAPRLAKPERIVAPAWSTVTLEGEGFAATGNQVRLGGKLYPFTLDSADGRTLVVPLMPFTSCSAGQTCTLYVINSGGTSNQRLVTLTAPRPLTATATATVKVWSAGQLRLETISRSQEQHLERIRQTIAGLNAALNRAEKALTDGDLKLAEKELQAYAVNRKKLTLFLGQLQKSGLTVYRRFIVAWTPINTRLARRFKLLSADLKVKGGVVVMIPGTTDLVAQGISFVPASLRAGEKVIFAGTVRNNGAALAGSSYARWCLDSVACITAPVEQLAEVAVGTLNLGSNSAQLTAEWKAAAGEHTVYLCADARGQVTETSKANNCATLTFSVSAPVATLPDLIVQDLTWSPSPTILQDSEVAFTAMVKNVSTVVSATSNVTLKIDNAAAGTTTVPSLAGGATTTVQWPVWKATYGQHFVEVCVNADRRLGESDETNNCLHQQITVNLKY